jgi:hypothetical protein
MPVFGGLEILSARVGFYNRHFGLGLLDKNAKYWCLQPPSCTCDELKSHHLEIKMRKFFDLAWSLIWSRAISIMSILIFSYFIGPDPFSAFGVFIAVVTILWVAVFFCYEQALFVCNKNEIKIVIRLCEILSVIFVVFTAILCVIIFILKPKFINQIDGLHSIILFIPFALAARAMQRLITCLATRDAQFDLLAKLNWMQAGAQAVMLLLLMMAGWPGVVCLVAAELCGLVAVNAYCLRAYPQFRPAPLSGTNFDQLRSCARRWRALPTWRLLMSLTSVIALGLPALVIPLHYPAAIAGQVLFAMRMLDVPSNVISGAVSPILQGNLMSPDRTRARALREVLLIASMNSAIFAALGAASYVARPLFDGSAWIVAVAVFLPLTLYFMGLTTSAPLVGAVVGPEVERPSAIAQFGFLATNCIIAALISAGLPLTWVLVAFGLSMLLRSAAFGVLYVNQAGRAVPTDKPAPP